MADEPGAHATATTEQGGKVRLDKWLWYARVYKSRSIAQTEIKAGKIRVNSVKTGTPSRTVVPGDVMTITKPRQVLILKMVACGVRRGPASEAQQLYEDLTPPPPKPKDVLRPVKQAARDEGAGRPTKKERREISRYRSSAGEEF